MSGRAPFIAAIAAAPDDDLPRLVFADWLDEHGDPERAEFIRLQVACFREAEQFPPVIDQAKLNRIRELFLANYRDWLRPVYEAFGQPLPVFDARPPVGEPTTLVGRGARWFGELFRMFSGGDFGATPWGSDADSLEVEPDGLFVSHRHGNGRPLGGFTVRRGLVDSATVSIDNPFRKVDLSEAMLFEPLVELDVEECSSSFAWRRVDGPHLARVRSLAIDFEDDEEPDENGRRAESWANLLRTVCRSKHLTKLQSLSASGIGGEAFLRELRASSLCGQLTRLSLDDRPPVWQVLRHPQHGLDSLRELHLSYDGGPAGEAGLADSLRRQLTRLVVRGFHREDYGWLFDGSPWVQLEHLELWSEPLGDTGATALAGSTQFPALRVLHLSSNRIQDAGAVALARSPWVPQLRALFFELNRITDAGAVELASLLDRGLGYLDLRCYFRGAGVEIADECISLPTQRRLKERYGPRIDFPRPNDG